MGRFFVNINSILVDLNIHLLPQSGIKHIEYSTKYLLYYSTKGKPYGFGMTLTWVKYSFLKYVNPVEGKKTGFLPYFTVGLHALASFKHLPAEFTGAVFMGHTTTVMILEKAIWTITATDTAVIITL